jgi:hypothetical protein
MGKDNYRGEWIAWSAVKQRDAKPEMEGEENKDKEEYGQTGQPLVGAVGGVWYPPGHLASAVVPDTGTFLFRHATVWTNTAEGIVP